MRYLVDHYNLGQSFYFDTLDAAKAFAVKANFDASIWRVAPNGVLGDLVARYSSIRGMLD